MPKKRSKDQITALILRLCLGDGANKTQIVYQTNLQFKMMIWYLDLLLEKGLLDAVPGKHMNIIYKTTKKGERFLESLDEVEEICS
jgi:predicted transcriptional regulator